MQKPNKLIKSQQQLYIACHLTKLLDIRNFYLIRTGHELINKLNQYIGINEVIA